MNFLRGEAHSENGHTRISIGGQSLAAPSGLAEQAADGVLVGIRAENIRTTADRPQIRRRLGAPGRHARRRAAGLASAGDRERRGAGRQGRHPHGLPRASGRHHLAPTGARQAALAASDGWVGHCKLNRSARARWRSCARTISADGPSPRRGCIRISGVGTAPSSPSAWRHVDLDRALHELESLFRAQWQDGRVPHIVFNPEARDYFPGPGRWGAAEASPLAPREPATSGLVQPPIHAIALSILLARLARRDASSALLERVNALYPRMLAWHRYLATLQGSRGHGPAQHLSPVGIGHGQLAALGCAVCPPRGGRGRALRAARPEARHRSLGAANRGRIRPLSVAGRAAQGRPLR